MRQAATVDAIRVAFEIYMMKLRPLLFPRWPIFFRLSVFSWFSQHNPVQVCGWMSGWSGTSSVKSGTIQRRLAWHLREDDTHTSRSVSHFSDRTSVMNSFLMLLALHLDLCFSMKDHCIQLEQPHCLTTLSWPLNAASLLCVTLFVPFPHIFLLAPKWNGICDLRLFSTCTDRL